METAVKKLEVLLNKTESDVDALSAKLDQEFAALSLENSGETSVEPTKILNNIRHLRSELQKVTQDLESFQKEQQGLMAEVQERLSVLSDHFVELNSITEAAQKDSEEAGSNE